MKNVVRWINYRNKQLLPLSNKGNIVNTILIKYYCRNRLSRMKQFFKYVFATVTGVVISFFLLFLIGLAIIAGLVSSFESDKSVDVKSNSVLHIDLSQTITERTTKSPFDELDIPGMSGGKNIGLNDIIAGIEGAKTDDRIKGIYLDISSVSASFATLQEIRDALTDFKSSEKFILAYSEYYTQKAYYLASTADKVYLNPEGLIDFRGMASNHMFLKGTLDKLGIEAQVIKVGTYKSAVEPLIQDKMSEANREQVTSFVGDIYNHYLHQIADSRNIAKDSLFAIADELKVRDAQSAVDHKLADSLKYKDEVLDEIRTLLDIEKDTNINSVSLTKYSPDKKKSTAKDRIAVIYAVGDIMSGEGTDEQIGSERISRAIRKVRTDDKVKAVVLRVNSPGGSALASDVIWREVALTKQEKPIIVSMGDVAASGGYYIACAADSIIAQPNTITGSIGVFGVIPNLKDFFNNKLGITFDEVKTGRYADLGNVNRPLTADERAIIQHEVNKIYRTFIEKVAEGRGLSPEKVDSIGQGRVWTGNQAVSIGLVDRLGSLDDAIQAAARKAGLEDYRIVNYPSLKDPLQELLGRSGDQIKSWMMQREFGEHYTYYQQASRIIQLTGIQARLPFVMEIN